MELRIHLFFHLNLAFSSIEEAQRPEVIRRCYWPLLDLIRKERFPCGIEVTAFTLETIERIDHDWIRELRALMADGLCEFIGSGYTQLIGPLVPAEINRANLRIGNKVYERILGNVPRCALVNEQAYSPSLIPHFTEAGYRAIIMEWENPARAHPEWNPTWRYLPQYAVNQHGDEIPVVWNQSIAFQKFQRYAHGEIDLDEYVENLTSHLGSEPRAFAVYGNDAEVFDFRPGRFHNESQVEARGEWNRIGELIRRLRLDPRFRIAKPSDALSLMHEPDAANRLRLESAQAPIPVKKQGKYNVTRWAVTGRDDVGINTACWRLFQTLTQSGCDDDALWRELCELWSSDCRTHITPSRWKALHQKLRGFARKIGCRPWQEPSLKPRAVSHLTDLRLPSNISVACDDRFLTFDSERIRLRLNVRRGLAVDRLTFPEVSDQWLCGTLPHGYFRDINWGADFYTGHVVFESPGMNRVTDLNPSPPAVRWSDAPQTLTVEGRISTPLGEIRKIIRVRPGDGTVELVYRLDWHRRPPGSLRLGHLTLNPDAFDRRHLGFETHNGGDRPDSFLVGDGPIQHGAPVSFLVSASNCLGMTGNLLTVGDRTRLLEVQRNPAFGAALPMVTCCDVDDRHFFRVSFSAGELDETCQADPQSADIKTGSATFGFTLSARTNLAKPCISH